VKNEIIQEEPGMAWKNSFARGGAEKRRMGGGTLDFLLGRLDLKEEFVAAEKVRGAGEKKEKRDLRPRGHLGTYHDRKVN